MLKNWAKTSPKNSVESSLITVNTPNLDLLTLKICK